VEGAGVVAVGVAEEVHLAANEGSGTMTQRR